MFAAQRLAMSVRPAMAAARRQELVSPTKVAVRRMGGGHSGPAPTYTGFEAKVRSVLKEDWQLVLGIVGFYTSLYLVSKVVFRGGKKTEEPATAAAGGGAAPSTSSDVVSMADDKFSEWANIPGNLERWEKSLNDEKSYA